MKISVFCSTLFLALLFEPAPAPALTWESAPGWTVDKDAVSSQNIPWKWLRIQSEDSTRDGCLAGVAKIVSSIPLDEPRGPNGSEFYGNDVATASFEKRYEAGVVFRQSGGGYYRVGFSSRDQEVSLWRSDGGFLAVKPFPIKAGEDIPFQIDYSGPRIKVSVGGTEVIDCLDLRPLIAPGRIGFADFMSTVTFSKVTLGKTLLNPARAEIPVDFSHRQWHGRDWFFNGLEPIACLDDGLGLNCKIGACYRMIGLSPACWLQYRGPEWYANKQVKVDVRETGSQLKCMIEGKTPGEEIVSHFLMTITYDKGARMYTYDFDSDFTVQKGKTWLNTYGLEFSDFIPYNVTGPSVTPGAWPCYYPWIVWRSKDGHLYKYPINHDDYYPVTGKRDETAALVPEGGFIGFFGEEINPVTRIVKSQFDVIQGLCNWAHDMHLDYPKPAKPMPEGSTYAIHFQLVGVDRAAGDTLIAQASFPPDATHLDWEYPVFQQGVNDFRKGQVLATPHAVQLWRKGSTEVPWYDEPVFWDRKTGFDDKGSIRIDGPFSVASPLGTSAFMPPFTEKRYLISAMIKTENVKGSSPYIGFYGDSNKAPLERFQTGILGTHDWTRVGWFTEGLKGMGVGWLRLGLPGTGKVWFDKVEIRPLKDGEEVALPKWKQEAEPAPMPDLLVWLKMNDGEGAGALDYSHHGNSAELRGLKWVRDEERGMCVEGDGTGMATIESKPELDFNLPFSFSCWVKPSTGGGNLFAKYMHIGFRLQNSSAPFRIGFDMNGKYNTHQTEAKVPAGSWSFVVVTHDGKSVRIYLDGVKVWEKEQAEKKVNSSPFPLGIGGFWHEGKVQTSTCFHGRMGEVKFHSTALSDEEIKKEFEAGKTPGK